MSAVGEPDLIEKPRRRFYERHEPAILGGVALVAALSAGQAVGSASKIPPLVLQQADRVIQ